MSLAFAAPDASAETAVQASKRWRRPRNVALVGRRWLRQRGENYVFYTVRYVLADDESSAEALAISLARAELREKNLAPFAGDAIVVRRDEIVELSWFEDALLPGAGFTFFPEGT